MVNEKLLVLIINDMVIFPNNEIRIEYDNTFDKPLIDVIEKIDNDLMLIVNPIENGKDNDITSLPKYGVLGKLKLRLNVPNGKTRIVMEGVKRVNIHNYSKEDKFYKATYDEIEIPTTLEDETYINILIKALNEYINKVPHIGNAIISQLNQLKNLSDLCDIICSFLPLDYEKKKKYIYVCDPIERSKMLIEDMKLDLKFIELEKKIENEVENELSKTQKEFFLREKIKLMQKELGQVNSKEDELVKLKKRCSSLRCNSKVKERIRREISRYEAISSTSPELGLIRDYLDWLLNLPWESTTKDITDLIKVKQSLDSSHYALEEVKDRILEYLAVKQNTNSLRSPILCLVGPPGVGKTSLAISIAKSLNRKFTKISVGGINDEAEIVGHRRTYVGANPGRIIQGIRKAGTKNPVFIIDEIDKMTKDIKGDPASSLLEVLDPEQNNKFSDHYIEEEFDLSKVFFIATANYIEEIPYELKDRLEIITLSSYTEYEKFDIAKQHIIPKLLEEHGLTPLQVQLEDSAIITLIRNYTKEAGVRELQRVIASLLRKIVKQLLLDSTKAFYKIDNKMLEELLGKKKYLYSTITEKNESGVVNGMAYTAFGGDILPIEATLYKGKGKLILTGCLGDVMQESCKIALSYIKSNLKKFKIDENLIENNDIHIHFPEGAVNKDGPSAGIAITTALISLFKDKKVAKNIAMTGEITLRGRVLAIGGLKEKVIGSHRAGVRKIYLPQENEPDLEVIPSEIKKDIDFIFVNNYIDIYNDVFKKEIINVS